MNNKIQDERVKQNKTKALANAAIIGEILLLVKIIFEIFTDKATLLVNTSGKFKAIYESYFNNISNIYFNNLSNLI